MDQVVPVQTFNGPLEAGVRAVAVLSAMFPHTVDVHRLVAYDYLLVHTHDLGGPEDLHPSGLIRTPGTEVRRKVVQRGIALMMTRDLIAQVVRPQGIRYRGGETAVYFLDSLGSPYLSELKRRACWLAEHLRNYTDPEFHSVMRRLFDAWVMEFQAAERSLGGEL